MAPPPVRVLPFVLGPMGQSGTKKALALLVVFVSSGCSTSPAPTPVAPTSASNRMRGCSRDALAVAAVDQPIFNCVQSRSPLGGARRPVDGRNTVVIQLDISVDTTGALHGSITRVHRVRRERDTGRILGDLVDSGGFSYFGNTPCRVYDPLLLYGHENLTNVVSLRANDPLGFERSPAMLSVDVTIVDRAGATWTISRSVAWEIVPPPRGAGDA